MFKKSIFFILSLCVAIVPSCQKNTSALDRAIAEYNNGQWLLAKMYAEESIEKQQQVNEASYVIGLCEFRTKRVNSAKEWFEKAAQSLNKDAQSKSQAMLGIIAESEGNHEHAELLFLKAAENLDASNQRRAIGKSGKNVADIANANSSFFALQFGETPSSSFVFCFVFSFTKSPYSVTIWHPILNFTNIFRLHRT